MWKKHKVRRHKNLWPNGLDLSGTWWCDLYLMAIQLTSSRGFSNFDLIPEKSTPKRVGPTTPEGPKNDENFFFKFRSFFAWIVFSDVLTDVNKRFYQSCIYFAPQKYPVLRRCQKQENLAGILRKFFCVLQIPVQLNALTPIHTCRKGVSSYDSVLGQKPKKTTACVCAQTQIHTHTGKRARTQVQLPACICQQDKGDDG